MVQFSFVDAAPAVRSRLWSRSSAKPPMTPSGHCRSVTSSASVRYTVTLPLLLVLLCVPQIALAGDKATLENALVKQDVSYRQDVCDRYEQVRLEQVSLRNALSGLSLRPTIMGAGYFNYDSEAGIDPDDGGLQAELLDDLARRANFTWRDSFGILEVPADLNITYTEILVWSVERYDVAVSWWDQSFERMERGVAFIEHWFDGAIILIHQQTPFSKNKNISIFNWLRPFENSVWALIFGTVILAALVYQLIEYLHDERDDRSLSQWFSDSLYLSSLNVTQNFEYAPNSAGGRIFGVGMGIWALVVSASYTANLASLLVDENKAPTAIESIDQAVALQLPVCTYGKSNSEKVVQKRYPNAILNPKSSELESYEALRKGECVLTVGYKDSWLNLQGTIQSGL